MHGCLVCKFRDFYVPLLLPMRWKKERPVCGCGAQVTRCLHHSLLAKWKSRILRCCEPRMELAFTFRRSIAIATPWKHVPFVEFFPPRTCMHARAYIFACQQWFPGAHDLHVRCWAAEETIHQTYTRTTKFLSLITPYAPVSRHI